MGRLYARLNSVKCVTCTEKNLHLKQILILIYVYHVHPTETTVINRKADIGDNGLICSACHKVHSFTVTKEAKPVHTK